MTRTQKMGMDNLSMMKNSNYVQAQVGTLNQPKEIGLLQRAEGVSGGLKEIASRLMTFTDRVSGQPSCRPNEPSPPASGLPATLSECEQIIRDIISVISSLEKTF